MSKRAQSTQIDLAILYCGVVTVYDPVHKIEKAFVISNPTYYILIIFPLSLA